MDARNRQSGVAAVEFALLLAFLLVPIVYGTTEIGRAFYQYNTLVKASRAAAREYTLAGRSGTVGSRETLATCLAIYGHVPCGGGDAPLLPGLSEALVTIGTTDSTLPGTGLTYTYGCVSINGFQFRSLVPFVVPDITFAPITTCMRQVP